MNSPTLKTLIWYIIYESSPYSVIPVIYIQPEGGHVGFCQDVGPMAANMLKIGIVDLWTIFGALGRI